MSELHSVENVKKFLIECFASRQGGVLADIDIENAIYNGEIFIYPFLETCLTPIGYNFCSSEVIISTHTGLPLEVREKHGERYVIVPPNDTVLISTREYLSIQNSIMGTFHSRVKVVSTGFGHISTTLDPGWKGPLLISLNNPNADKLKFIISNNRGPVPFASLIFYRFNSLAKRKHDNPPYRVDILENYVARPSLLKKILLGKSFENYDGMVRKIHTSMQLSEANIKGGPLIQEMEQCIVELKNISIGESLDSIGTQTAFENYFRCLGKNKKIHEFSSEIEKIFEYLKYGIQYYWKNSPGFFNEQEFQEIYQNYLDLCYRRIQDEKIGRYWCEQYAEIKKMAAQGNGRLTFILGLNWKKIVFQTALLVLLIFLTFKLGEYNFSNISSAIIAPVLAGAIGSIVLNFMGSGPSSQKRK